SRLPVIVTAMGRAPYLAGPRGPAPVNGERGTRKRGEQLRPGKPKDRRADFHDRSVAFAEDETLFRRRFPASRPWRTFRLRPVTVNGLRTPSTPRSTMPWCPKRPSA